VYRIADWIRNSDASGDGGIVLDTKHSRLFGFNAVGARIFELLRRGETPASIVSQVATEFAMDRATVERDFAEFVGQLVECRLVELETPDENHTCS
jgi:hypothetical protein